MEFSLVDAQEGKPMKRSIIRCIVAGAVVAVAAFAITYQECIQACVDAKQANFEKCQFISRNTSNFDLQQCLDQAQFFFHACKDACEVLK